ncbi:MAG: YIP1 family protein [Bryobacteraceae bacterium]
MSEQAGSAIPAGSATGGLAGGLTGMMNVFVDPAETARRVPSKLSWLWPVIVLAIIYTVFGYLMLPYAMQLVDARMAERNMPPEQLERAQSMAHTVTKFTTPLAPLWIIGFLALTALLIKVFYSIMDVRPRFRDVFSLLAACSIIPALQYIATYIVLRSKGDAITSPEQLMPPFGLDIFLQGAKGVFLAILHFFSIFEIWYLIVLVLGLSYLTRSSKSKAIIAATPAWVLPLLLALLGALFQQR